MEVCRSIDVRNAPHPFPELFTRQSPEFIERLENQAVSMTAVESGKNVEDSLDAFLYFSSPLLILADTELEPLFTSLDEKYPSCHRL